MVNLEIPPLRRRLEDLRVLVDFLLRTYGEQFCREVPPLSPDVMDRFREHKWPGNIRELENTLERAVILSPQDIQPESILVPQERRSFDQAPVTNLKGAGKWGRRLAESELIKKALAEAGGNKMEVSRRLKVSYKTLLKRIKEYGISS